MPLSIEWHNRPVCNKRNGVCFHHKDADSACGCTALLFCASSPFLWVQLVLIASEYLVYLAVVEAEYPETRGLSNFEQRRSSSGLGCWDLGVPRSTFVAAACQVSYKGIDSSVVKKEIPFAFWSS